MPKYTIDGTTLSDVADAVRELDGNPDTMTPAQMASRIRAVQPGGADLSVIANDYDTTATYDVGEYCIYDGGLYVCNTAISTAEAWTAGHWEEVTVGDELSDVKSDLSQTQSAVTNLADKALMAPDSDATNVDLDVTDPDGNVIVRFAGGHVQTKNFDSEDISDRVTALEEETPEVPGYPPSIMESNASDVDLDLTDTFGNVVARFEDGHIKTKNFDSSDINTEELEALTEDVADLKDATSGILYRNKDVTDGVYAACRWHQPNASSKQFCFLVAGDIHNDATRMNSMIEYMNAIDAFDGGIMLGDIAGSISSSIEWYNQAVALSNKPFLTVIGNHDCGAGSDPDQTIGYYTNISQMYEKFFEPNIQYAQLASGEYTDGNTYYYKDYASYKLRLIVLNQYEYPPDVVTDGSAKTFVYTRGQVCYSQAQINWFCSVLNSTPSDYGIIICLHTYPCLMTVDKTDPFTSSTAKTNDISVHLISSTNGYIIEEIVNAWINGTSLAQTYDYTVSGTYGTSISVNADFTSRGAGEFITYIGGHWHMTVFGKTRKYGQKYFSVPAAGLSAAVQGDTPRRAGTMSEDNFCAIAIDRDLHTVKVLQIGAHFTKDAVDRRYGQYSYLIESN